MLRESIRTGIFTALSARPGLFDVRVPHDQSARATIRVVADVITRGSVIELARHMGYTVVERPIDKSELFVAEEVFLTGTAAKVTPVRRVECTDLSSDRPVMNALRERITAITEGRDPNFEHWVTRIRIE